MEFHEIANIFPLMDGPEFAALVDDIKQNGLLDPIIIHENKIIDGRNRYRACLAAGIEPRFEEWKQNDMPMLDWVVSKNLHRRHLNETQRSVVAKKLTTFNLGDNQYTIGSANLPTQNTVTQARAAKMLNVSERTIRTVAAVEREKPEFMPMLESGQMSAHEAYQQIKHEKREADIQRQREEIKKKPEPPSGLYDVVVIDPPWPYGTKYDAEGRRAANPYPEMNLDQIAALKIPASDNSVLWLWTTHKFMRHSFDLIDTWGFRDVAIMTWAKDRIGLGSWLRSQSEFCIMAVKGSPTIQLTNQSTVLHGPLREHSRKPDEFYRLVDSLCVGRKIDFFSREKRDGWAQFGNDEGRFENEY
jgi:N6-adenosine-specific RNA methylase IME4